MLLKLTLASIAFAAVAAQSNSAITAEIERLQLLMVSANNKECSLHLPMAPKKIVDRRERRQCAS